jgi:hypothetical protein
MRSISPKGKKALLSPSSSTLESKGNPTHNTSLGPPSLSALPRPSPDEDPIPPTTYMKWQSLVNIK